MTGSVVDLLAAVKSGKTDVGIAAIVMRRPTLDDVYNALTGHAAEEVELVSPELAAWLRGAGASGVTVRPDRIVRSARDG